MATKRKPAKDSQRAVPEVQSAERPEMPPAVQPDRVPPRAVGTRRLDRLDGFKFTAPVSMSDLSAARDLLRADAPDASIEVHCHTGACVVIDLQWPDQHMRRDFDVTS